MTLSWSDLSKAQQRETKEWFERIFGNSFDDHGIPITWENLKESERGQALGKLWKHHHGRNKADHAFMKAQDDKRKTEAKAKKNESERELKERLADPKMLAENEAKAVALIKGIVDKNKKEEQRTSGLAKRRKEFEKTFKEKMSHIKPLLRR